MIARTRIWAAVALTCGVGLLALASQTVFVQTILSRFVGGLGRPVLLGAQSVQEHGQLLFFSKRELAELLRERETQMADLARQAAEWRQAAADADRAYALLEYRGEHAWTFQAAKVLVRLSRPDTERVSVDKGRAHGVEAGMAVLSSQGALVGVVDTVLPSTSLVALLSHASTRLGVAIMGTSDTLGVLGAGSGGGLEVRYVPQTAAIKPNDILVTSGLDPLIPAGIPIGLVLTVEQDPNTPFLIITATPLATDTTLSLVDILIGV